MRVIEKEKMETKDSTYYEELMAAYFAGEASGAKQIELAEWIQASSDNQAQFEEARKIWHSYASSQLFQRAPTDVAWMTISDKISKKAKARRSAAMRPLRTKLYLAAAILAGIALISTLILRNISSTEMLKVTSDGTPVTFGLPDGSIISLHYGKITYPKVFDSERAISLEGEAYFEVAKDSLKPFVITADNAEIKVLGTKFLVNEQKVVVSQGKVAVKSYANAGEHVLLLAGQEAFIRNGKPVVQQVKDQNQLSWKNKELYFKDTKLSDVAFQVGRHFDVPITIANDSLASMTVTASFRNQNIESVLKVITIATGTVYDKLDEGYVIEKKPVAQ